VSYTFLSGPGSVRGRMVGVAQLVEHLVVVQVVAGSNPVTHPNLCILEPMANTDRAARRQAAAAELRRVQLQQRRSRLVWTGAVVAVVIVIFASVAIFGLNHHGGSGAKTTSADTKLLQSLSSIPAATYDAVGAGVTSNPPARLSGASPLTAGGKPRILYVGAEYCPYCAAERWAVVTALARFGTFADLGETTSSHIDAYPDTATLSFHGATYTSKYLSFTGYETQSNQVQGNTYAPLDKLSTADGKLFDKYDFPPYVPTKGAIPFIDIGGKYVSQGATYDPALLAGLTQQAIAAGIANPDSPVSKAVLGSANRFTAAFCRLTGNQPASVCTSAGVTAAAAGLPR
jgi:hypothetical protein